ncbi:MAG: mechanosensitive ion channel [Bacteroidales bacterium]|nr:mechanosensitive ion channel [Bacteroidales bacterium]
MNASFFFVPFGDIISNVKAMHLQADDVMGLDIRKGMLAEMANKILEWCGVSRIHGIYSDLISIAIGVVAAVVIYMIARHVIARIIKHVVAKSASTIDDAILNHTVIHRGVVLFPSITILAFCNGLDETSPLIFIVKICAVVTTFHSARFIVALLGGITDAFVEKGSLRRGSVNGIYQLISLAIYIIMTIIMVSILIERSPLKLLAGFGASAAIITLIFKDTIEGFVAGIQLSLNRMVEVGDWIEVPGSADGVVQEITLNTVKIQNWNNTITTIPPSTLKSHAFNNWKGMQESDGRRITCSINIDMTSVEFLSDSAMTPLHKMELLNTFFENEGESISSQTNLTAFRAYMVAYLKSLDVVNSNMTLMTRVLNPNQYGLPVEFYCFSKDKRWENYEEIRGRILDHALAMLPNFNLRVYQR